jgi:NAD(P)-dependent dehydrogenase (short-subunit alcohol dehydrogenase family)
MPDSKCIFITGAASGIGRATALHFAQRGWFVGLYDINEQELEKAANALETDRMCFQKLDVTDVDQVKAALEHFSRRTAGKMHVLFNCAGLLKTGPFESIPFEAHKAITRVNVEGVLNCTYHAFTYLHDTRPAVVISMTSASALYGTPDYATYSSTKFWVRGFTEALNIEWERHGIHVCDILTPFVDTPLLHGDNSRAIQSLGVKLSPEDLAQVVWQAAHGRKVHWVVTPYFKFNWIVARRLPDWLAKIIIRRTCGY